MSEIDWKFRQVSDNIQDLAEQYMEKFPNNKELHAALLSVSTAILKMLSDDKIQKMKHGLDNA